MYKIRVFKKLSRTAVAETRRIRYKEKDRPLAWARLANLTTSRLHWRIGYAKNRSKYSNVRINLIVVILKK